MKKVKKSAQNGGKVIESDRKMRWGWKRWGGGWYNIRVGNEPGEQKNKQVPKRELVPVWELVYFSVHRAKPVSQESETFLTHQPAR